MKESNFNIFLKAIIENGLDYPAPYFNVDHEEQSFIWYHKDPSKGNWCSVLAIVDIENDDIVRYAYKLNGQFVGGDRQDCPVSQIPSDLKQILEDNKSGDK